MKGICRTFAVYSLTFLASPVLSQGSASDLILHLPLDGNIVATGNLSGSTELIGPSGEPIADAGSALAYTDGQFGQAALFSGDWVVRIPLDLSLDVYPELTISAWIKPEGKPTGYILSTRNSQGPALNVSTSWAGMRGPGPQLGESGILRSGRWIFIAGVWNVNTGEMRFHYGRRSETAQINAEPKSSAMDVWVGGFDDSNNSRARNLVIDDVRVYARAMTSEEINQLASSNLTLGQEPIQVTSDFEVPELESDTGTDDSVAEPMFTGITNQIAEGLDVDTPSTAADELEEARTSDDNVEPSSGDAEGAKRVTDWRFSSTDVQRTAVSGESARSKPFSEIGESRKGFNDIEVREVSNIPCAIEIGSSVNTSDSIVKCSAALVLDQHLQANIGDATIRALTACTNNTNSRVKGIEIRGNVINDDGTLGSFWQDSEKHKNCGENEWRKTVICADGYAATGVVGHFNERSGSEELVGLQLICRKIEKIYE